MEQAVAERPPAARAGRGANPYVGPRPLQSSDTLYGRTRELHELGDLLIAERIVLLYSPSGAGKTSLINAGLVKRLREQERFRVLPSLRVSLTGNRHAQDFPNRYMRSVVECLLADLTEEQCKTLTASAMPCLSDYLGQRPHRAEDGPVDSRFELLIFDQLEEICTLDPTDIGAKEAFFRELGDALRDRHRWALFVIREDHLAEIDAFSHLLPTALASRYRLNLLTIDQARQAIAGPATAAGRSFAPEHVARLADDLATVTVLGPAGATETIGASVEPVQLQVVCRRLWQRYSEGEASAWRDIRTGAVDEALADFYDAALERVAREQLEESPKDRQRRIRNWIERHLIIKPGIRNQIMRGLQSTEELPDDCVSALVSEHLLRVDRRGGRDWIEITHDRMIVPIVNSNEKWRKRHLQLYQLRADLWNRNNRSADMLLSQDDYDAALRWQKEHPGKPGDVEQAFLDASGAALAQHAAVEDNKRKMRLWGGSILLIVALALAWQWVSSSRHTKLVTIEKLNGEALSLPQGQYQTTLNKAVTAYDLWRSMHGEDPSASDRLLRKIHAAMLAGLVSVPPVQQKKSIARGDPAGAARAGGAAAREECALSPAAVRQLAFNPVRRLLAAACADGTVALWNLDRPDEPLKRLQAAGQAWSVAFNPAGTLLAVGGNAGVRLWRIDPKSSGAGDAVRGEMPGLPLRERVMAVAFSDDNLLGIAQANGDVSVRDPNRLRGPALAVFQHEDKELGVLTSITFMHDKLAFAGWRGDIWVWPWRVPGGDEIGPGKTARLNFFDNDRDGAGDEGDKAGIADLAYHAGSDQLAATGWIRKKTDGSDPDGHSYTAVWSDASTTPRLTERGGRLGRESVSHALAFSPDGSALAYTGAESRVLSFMASPVLPASEGPASAAPVRFQERLFSVAFSPDASDDGNLVAVGDGEMISLLDLRQAGPLVAPALPMAEPFDSRADHYHAAMSADGSVVAVAAGAKLAISRQGSTVANYVKAEPIPHSLGELDALAVAPRGDLVAAAGPLSTAVALFDRNGRDTGYIPLGMCTDAGAQRGVVRLAFRPDSGPSQLAIANGRNLCIVELGGPAGPQRLPLSGPPAGADIVALAYSNDGRRLAALSGDNTIRVHVDRGTAWEFPAPVTRVTALAFTPNPRYLAFGTDDADIWILDIDKHLWSRLDQLHDAAISSLRFGGQGDARYMLSSDREGRIIMWDRADDKVETDYNRLGRPLAQKGKAAPMAVSDNGELLLVGGPTPRMYDLRMESLLALACNNVKREEHATCSKVKR